MVRYWLYGAAAALSCVAIARILFLLSCRRPAQALICDTDLTEMVRRRDRDMRWVARFDNVPTEDDLLIRAVTARVAYEVDGEEYRADVCLPTRRGDAPDTAPVIWFDPSRPTRATGIGLGLSTVPLLIGITLAIFASYLDF